jgi:cell division protein FtsI/penicillin-binding protein 2
LIHFAVRAAGKTGSAENFVSGKRVQQDHSIFSFAPRLCQK